MKVYSGHFSKHAKMLTCQLPDFSVERYFRKNVSHAWIHVVRKN